MRRYSLGTAAIIAFVLSACAAATPATGAFATPIVAPQGVIIVPECQDTGACEDAFVVGQVLYGLVCFGVDRRSVEEQPLATGDGMFAEARVITGIPSEMWLAVRGDLPCRPRQDAPLEHDWYLAQAAEGVDPADLETWGEAVSDVVLP